MAQCLFGGLAARLHRYISLGINWIACIHKPLQRGDRIVLFQKRAFPVPRRAPGQGLEIGLQPQGNRLFRDQRAGGIVHERPAAAGNHADLAAEQPGDGFALQHAERRFAVFLEYPGNGFAGFFDDDVVGIGETDAQRQRQRTALGRFAAAHQTDQHHRTVEGGFERDDVLHVIHRT